MQGVKDILMPMTAAVMLSLAGGCSFPQNAPVAGASSGRAAMEGEGNETAPGGVTFSATQAARRELNATRSVARLQTPMPRAMQLGVRQVRAQAQELPIFKIWFEKNAIC